MSRGELGDSSLRAGPHNNGLVCPDKLSSASRSPEVVQVEVTPLCQHRLGNSGPENSVEYRSRGHKTMAFHDAPTNILKLCPTRCVRSRLAHLNSKCNAAVLRPA